MAYDVSALIQEVKDRAKDSTLSDSLITTFLQDTQDAVLGHYRLPWLEQTATATLAVNDLTYNYPSDHQSTLGVALSYSGSTYRPDYMSYTVFDGWYASPSDAQKAPPQNFTDYNHRIYWNAPLDKAYTLTLKYLRRPVQFTSTAIVPDIPQEYKQILIRGALASVEEYRENFDIAAIHQRKVEDLAEDMLQRYGARQLVTPHKATTARTRSAL